jgi:Protein of unknown function C-terminus (DUF2399)
MAQRVASHAVPLAGVPDGLLAFPVEQVRDDGTAVRTRRGRAKLAVVELRSASVDLDPAVGDCDDAFVLGATRRRWTTIEDRYGTIAWSTAVRLTAAGAIRLRCRVDAGSRVGAPVEWVLSPALDAERERQRETAARAVEYWVLRAEDAAGRVEKMCPELATALRVTNPRGSGLEVLVHAAEDLVAGMTHASPRAFSQTHFGDTKARDDVIDVLRAAGVPDEVAVILGVSRGDRVGLAGPVVARVGEQSVRFEVLHGPVLVRADQPALALALEARCPLVVVENLQAAESIADRLPHVAVFYTAGMLGARALELLDGLVSLAEPVVVAVDADAGGVRIAEQVLGVAPRGVVLDAGAYAHTRRELWRADGLAHRALERARDGPAARLAAACLRRGYPVEQEGAIVASVTDALRR